MTLTDFTNKWLGKRIDYDGVFQYQCVDLILQYLADCHGITSGVRGNAIDYWTNPSPAVLAVFDKTTGTPQAGDIVIIYGNAANPYGHIMVALDATTGLEQNGVGDGDGLNGDEVRKRTLPLSRVAGLLRPIKQGNDMSKVGEVEFNNLYIAFFGPIEKNPPTPHDRTRWIDAETNTVIRQMMADPRFSAYAQYVSDLEKSTGVNAIQLEKGKLYRA